MQLFADFHGQHTVEHDEHLVLMGMDMQVRSGCERWQLDLPQPDQAVGVAAGDPDEGSVWPSRQCPGVLLARAEDERRAQRPSQGSAASPDSGFQSDLPVGQAFLR
jgi:hypothetical protein